MEKCRYTNKARHVESMQELGLKAQTLKHSLGYVPKHYHSTICQSRVSLGIRSRVEFCSRTTRPASARYPWPPGRFGALTRRPYERVSLASLSTPSVCREALFPGSLFRFIHTGPCCCWTQARIPIIVEGSSVGLCTRAVKRQDSFRGFVDSKHLVLGRTGESRWANTRFVVGSKIERCRLKVPGQCAHGLASLALTLNSFLVFLAAYCLPLRSRRGQPVDI